MPNTLVDTLSAEHKDKLRLAQNRTLLGFRLGRSHTSSYAAIAYLSIEVDGNPSAAPSSSSTLSSCRANQSKDPFPDLRMQRINHYTNITPTCTQKAAELLISPRMPFTLRNSSNATMKLFCSRQCLCCFTVAYSLALP